MRVMPRNPTGDRKLIATSLRRVQPGQWCRQVDAHGRSFGPRLQREADLPRETRVRIARRQEEDIHSLMSRMLTRAHKAED